jgi:signal transduction histidine kinase
MSSPPPSPTRPHILVVDDSATLRAHLRGVLGGTYEVVDAVDGESGLAAALRRPPDLILSDVTMPGIDGHELGRRVRAQSVLSDVPFILMTSNQDPEGRALGLEEGADDYLQKSCSPRELLARVRSLLRLRAARLEILRQKEAIATAHGELLEAQRQLYESEKLATLGTVASGVAHELNNPLAFVLAGVEQLSECCRELGGLRSRARETRAVLTEVGEIQSDIGQGTERIRKIIRDLNLLAGDPDRKPVWVQPRSEVERALTIAQSKLMDIEVQTRFGHTGEVRLTPGYLTQITLSLVSNAADAVAGREGAWIRISTASAAEGFELSVEDNGTGIASEILPRIFEPFFSTKAAGKGMGLGLSVCAGLIKRLGGVTRVTSDVGKGCRFVVSLPAQVQDAQTDFMKSRVEASRHVRSEPATDARSGG